MRKSRVQFATKRLLKELFNKGVEEQTARLIAYAKDEVQKIGGRIQSFNSTNNLDRTGNLLNSLCWGVTYKGALKEGGFYREPILRNKGIAGTSEAYLHEWSGDMAYSYPVNGRELAEEFLSKGGRGGTNGWTVFFAILAPYWGYWETGFKIKKGFGGGSRFLQFAVMTQHYDKVAKDLSPARPFLTVTSAIRYTKSGMKKRHKRYTEI